MQRPIFINAPPAHPPRSDCLKVRKFARSLSNLKSTTILIVLASILIFSCQSAPEKSPKDMLGDAYQLFKEGDDAGSIKLAEEVLEIGRESKNHTLIGKALTSLCRNAQRNLDTNM